MTPVASGITSIELLLDAAAEALVRDDWEALASAGMSSMAGHEAVSNRPHVTLLARSTPVPHPLHVAGVALPLPVLLGPPLLFGDGDRRVLARSVVPSAGLLALHQAVLSAAGDGDGEGAGYSASKGDSASAGYNTSEGDGDRADDGDSAGYSASEGVGVGVRVGEDHGAGGRHQRAGRGNRDGASDGPGDERGHARRHGMLDERGQGADDSRHLFAPGRWTPHVTLARRIRLVDLPKALRLLGPPIDAHGIALRRWDAATATISSIDVR